MPRTDSVRADTTDSGTIVSTEGVATVADRPQTLELGVPATVRGFRGPRQFGALGASWRPADALPLDLDVSTGRPS